MLFLTILLVINLKQMNLVDTPGTNVILQRQQRLTEEFVPRADLILFVISADRPLTESEVTLFCVWATLYFMYGFVIVNLTLIDTFPQCQ